MERERFIALALTNPVNRAILDRLFVPGSARRRMDTRSTRRMD